MLTQLVLLFLLWRWFVSCRIRAHSCLPSGCKVHTPWYDLASKYLCFPIRPHNMHTNVSMQQTHHRSTLSPSCPECHFWTRCCFLLLHRSLLFQWPCSPSMRSREFQAQRGTSYTQQQLLMLARSVPWKILVLDSGGNNSHGKSH